MHTLPIVLAVIGGVLGLGVYYREGLAVVAVFLAFLGLCVAVPAAIGYGLGELLLLIF